MPPSGAPPPPPSPPLPFSDSPVEKVPIIGDHDVGFGLLDVFEPSLD